MEMYGGLLKSGGAGGELGGSARRRKNAYRCSLGFATLRRRPDSLCRCSRVVRIRVMLRRLRPPRLVPAGWKSPSMERFEAIDTSRLPYFTVMCRGVVASSPTASRAWGGTQPARRASLSTPYRLDLKAVDLWNLRALQTTSVIRGIAGTGITVFSQSGVAPPPPPAQGASDLLFGLS